MPRKNAIVATIDGRRRGFLFARGGLILCCEQGRRQDQEEDRLRETLLAVNHGESFRIISHNEPARPCVDVWRARPRERGGAGLYTNCIQPCIRSGYTPALD